MKTLTITTRTSLVNMDYIQKSTHEDDHEVVIFLVGYLNEMSRHGVHVIKSVEVK